MRTDWNENQALLVGEAVTEPTFSHTSHGEDFFRIPVKSLRLSGAEDVVNVIAARTLLDRCPVRAGERISVTGEVRSYNNNSGVGSRLVITIFAQELTEDRWGEDENRLRLAGVLCRTPVYRRTPLGREIADLLLAVNRPYGRADYLPCIAWGRTAQLCQRLDTGSAIRLQGRFQSRAYTKVLEAGAVKRVAYEVSILTLELVDTAAPETVAEL
jgi:single-stranded DNA-binding protein